MNFKTPFIEFQSELYSLLTKADEMEGLKIFDSSSAIDDILESFDDNFKDIKYVVISDITCTPTSAKTDTIIWHITARLELFSTYHGRMEIAKMTNTIGSVATNYLEAFNSNLNEHGYSVVRMNVGDCVTGSAFYNLGYRWQNGYINLEYYLYQNE